MTIRTTGLSVAGLLCALALVFLLPALAQGTAPEWDRAALGYENMTSSRDRSSADILGTNAFGFDITKGQWTDMIYLSAGDVDGDGNIDLMYSGWLEDSYIAWGNGDGTFEDAELFNPVWGVNYALGYVDGDTLIDVLTCTNSDVFLMTNNGDRTFDLSRVADAGGGMAGISVGYFNDDVHLDAVVSGGFIHFGDGTGAFPTTDTLPAANMWSAAVADFDFDGDDDLAIVQPHYAKMLLNDGDGNFIVSDSFETYQAALSVSTGNMMADFDSDGNPDFAVIVPMIGIERCGPNNFWRSVVTIAFGDGAGAIDHVDTLSVCGTSYNMGLADVDNDNALDIVIANASEKRLEVFLADGSGWFSPATQVDLLTDSLTHALALGDADNDGNIDAFAGGGLIWGDSLIVALNTAPDPQLLDRSIEVTGYNGITLAVTEPNNALLSRNYLTSATGRYERRDMNADGVLDEAATDRVTREGEYALEIKTRGEATPGQTFDAEVEMSNGQHAVLFRDYPVPATTKAAGKVISESILFNYTVEPVSSIAPYNGGPSNGVSPAFDWSGLIPQGVSPESFEFQLDNTHDFSSGALIEDVTGLTSSSFQTNAALTTGDVYYWRVRWYADGQWSEYSNTFAVLVTDFLCADINADGVGPDVSDLTYLVDYHFRGGPSPSNPAAADVNGSGAINVSDLTYLVDYLFRTGPAPTCGQ